MANSDAMLAAVGVVTVGGSLVIRWVVNAALASNLENSEMQLQLAWLMIMGIRSPSN